MNLPITGVYCAAATPLNADLSPDLGLFVAHCRSLLEEGCHGIALLGTTGEANSVSSAERKAILEAALRGGIAAAQLMPGTGVAAIPETVELTRHALANGVNRVVMLPPFYYKGVSDDGLFAAYARIIDAVNDDRLKIVLYHIPQMSGVPLGRGLVARLAAAFPSTVVGIKDSSGDLSNMQAMAAEQRGFSVLAGADPLMLPLLQAGGAGCITATANIIASSLRSVFDNFDDPTKAGEVEAEQATIGAYRALATSYVQILAVKAMLSFKSGEPGWNRVRPPLLPLDQAQLAELGRKYAALGGRADR